MLELPEARAIAAQLREALAGRHIDSAVAGASPHGFAFYQGEPASYAQILRGRRVDDAVSFAGYVQLRLDGGCNLSFFDGVNLRYLAPEAKRPKKHQLLLELDDGAALAASVQMYGGLMLHGEHELDANPYYRAARDAIDPLGDAFDRARFDALGGEKADKLSAKAWLATEQRIPGLGNGCLQDILYAAGVHPKRKVSALSDEEREGLFRALKQVLGEMVACGGRDTEKDLFGMPGGYRTKLSKHTVGAPCGQCGETIVKMAYMGGSVYLCPVCQPL